MEMEVDQKMDSQLKKFRMLY